MPVVVCSSKNELGVKCHSILKRMHANAVLVDEPLLDFTKIESDLVVFCSTHKSASSEPCFTTHSEGNFGDAKLGGEPKTLALTSATAIKTAFDSLKKQSLLQVFMEATHHGPTGIATSPCLFVELGATQTQWSDDALCTELCRACVEVAVCYNPKNKDAASLGFGGTHYCNAFNDIDAAFSFVCSKHYVDQVDEEMLDQMIAKTIEPVEKAFIDKKGCASEQRKKIISLLESKSIAWEFV